MIEKTVMWMPGEDTRNLFGFKHKRERDAYEAGAPGPFERIKILGDGKTVRDVRRENAKRKGLLP